MSMSCDKFPRILPQNLTTTCRKYVVMLRFCRIKVQWFPFLVSDSTLWFFMYSMKKSIPLFLPLSNGPA